MTGTGCPRCTVSSTGDPSPSYCFKKLLLLPGTQLFLFWIPAPPTHLSFPTCQRPDYSFLASSSFFFLPFFALIGCLSSSISSSSSICLSDLTFSGMSNPVTFSGPLGINSTQNLICATFSVSFSYSTGCGWSSSCRTHSVMPKRTRGSSKSLSEKGIFGCAFSILNRASRAVFILRLYFWSGARLKTVHLVSSSRHLPSPVETTMSTA
mmetsp:Transcript_57034/g.133825  ORF Transcript_57034/g.133825 Transcript_57034/m.133825 type:complete len:209 (-) Transcript_57034:669-1295(-)